MNNEEKIISEQSELCSDMVAEMKRFELLRRGTPDLPHFECGPFNHLGTSPYISVCFILEKFLERKAGENTEKYSIFDFENPLKSRISGGRNDQTAVKFRVLHLRPLGQLSLYVIPHFFQKLLERTDGKNNKIFNFRTEKKLILRAFLAEQTANSSKNFECSSLQPLQYLSVYTTDILYTKKEICQFEF